MAGTRASSLQAQWNLLENPPVCKHFTLELEMDDTGCVLNGDYYCIICGAVIAKQEAFACQSQHIPDEEEARGYSRDEGQGLGRSQAQDLPGTTSKPSRFGY